MALAHGQLGPHCISPRHTHVPKANFLIIRSGGDDSVCADAHAADGEGVSREGKLNLARENVEHFGGFVDCADAKKGPIRKESDT